MRNAICGSIRASAEIAHIHLGCSGGHSNRIGEQVACGGGKGDKTPIGADGDAGRSGAIRSASVGSQIGSDGLRRAICSAQTGVADEDVSGGAGDEVCGRGVKGDKVGHRR